MRKLMVLSALVFLAALFALPALATSVSVNCSNGALGQQVDFTGSQGEELGVSCFATLVPGQPDNPNWYAQDITSWQVEFYLLSSPTYPIEIAAGVPVGIEPCGPLVLSCSGYNTTIDRVVSYEGEFGNVLGGLVFLQFTNDGDQTVGFDGISVTLDSPFPTPEPPTFGVLAISLVGLVLVKARWR